MAEQRTVVIGISGCSSSGKTTLARLLRDIFPETFILHEDDFYKPESELPLKDGLVDWDCPEAISIPDLEAALTHIRETGTLPVSSNVPPSAATNTTTCSPSPKTALPSHRSNHGCAPSPPPLLHLLPRASPHHPPSPLSCSASSSPTNSLTTTPTPRVCPPTVQPTLLSKEDLNSVGPCPASPAHIASCAAKVRAWLAPDQPGSLIFPSSSAAPPAQPRNDNPNSEAAPAAPSNKTKTRICILEGFLLYGPAPSPFSRVAALLDIRLFLRASRAAAVRRREARDGYVTLEGFWKDPPGYVEKIVWPNYVDAHRWLFEGGVVDGGKVDWGVLEREGIRVVDGEREDVDFVEMLEWAVRAVMEGLEGVCLAGMGSGEV